MVIPWKNGSQQLVSEWHERLRELENEIRTRPDDRWLWILQVRVRILKYLVSRYQDVAIAPRERPQAVEQEEAPAEASAAQRSAVEVDLDRRAYRASVRPQIRHHLESLEESNTERYARLPKAVPLPLNTAHVSASSAVELTLFAVLVTVAFPTLLAIISVAVWFLATMI